MIRKPLRVCLLLIVCFSVFLSSCAEEHVAEYVVPKEMKSIPSGITTKNNNYSLEWDDNAKCVLLKSFNSDYIWSTTPYDFLSSGESNYNLSSPIIIDYYNSEDGSINTINAADCIDYDMVSADKINDGIKATYYFDEAKITVAVNYKLRNDSLLISFNTSDIEEKGTNSLLNVSVAPYLCAAKNDNSHSSYLFVPAGSGALMYTDTNTDENPRSFSGEVYGNDPVRKQLTVSGKEEPVRLPVFGIKNGNNALCAIIEKGDGAATVKALAGSTTNGYSCVYASFNVRGYNNAELGTGSTIILNNKQPDKTEFCVGYYPLTGDSANYNGMATLYQNYLMKSGALKKSDQQQSAYHVTFAGGAQIKTHTLGVPHTSLLSLTTFNDAKEILEQLSKETNMNPSVLLKGFGKSGLNTGKIAGGYSFASILNKVKGQEKLENYCKNNGINLFTDFNIVQFSQSSVGFSTLKNNSLTANLQSAAIYPIKRNVLTENEDAKRVFLLARSELEKATDRLIQFCDDRVSGVGLSSLGSCAYSDYREDQYMLKGSLSKQAKIIMDKFDKTNHNVQLSAANGYIAGISSSITDVPLQNGGYDALDETVPFYEMVFKGFIPMYSTPLNLSPNAQSQLLCAVEAGVSPSFLITKTYDSRIAETDTDITGESLYKNNKELIIDTVKKTSEFLNKISNQKIKMHAILQSGVTKTVFESGVSVTVNHTNKAVNTEGTEIPAMSFSATE